MRKRRIVAVCLVALAIGALVFAGASGAPSQEQLLLPDPEIDLHELGENYAGSPTQRLAKVDVIVKVSRFKAVERYKSSSTLENVKFEFDIADVVWSESNLKAPTGTVTGFEPVGPTDVPSIAADLLVGQDLVVPTSEDLLLMLRWRPEETPQSVVGGPWVIQQIVLRDSTGRIKFVGSDGPRMTSAITRLGAKFPGTTGERMVTVLLEEMDEFRTTGDRGQVLKTALALEQPQSADVSWAARAPSQRSFDEEGVPGALAGRLSTTTVLILGGDDLSKGSGSPASLRLQAPEAIVLDAVLGTNHVVDVLSTAETWQVVVTGPAGRLVERTISSKMRPAGPEEALLIHIDRLIAQDPDAVTRISQSEAEEIVLSWAEDPTVGTEPPGPDAFEGD